MALFAAFAVSALSAMAPAFAQDDSTSGGSMKGMAGSAYTGRPKLGNMLALVEAGGGPSDFSAITLFGVLAGADAEPEKAKLLERFGPAGFARYVKTFDFVVSDSLKIVAAEGMALPAAAAPNPKNGRALAAALYMDGVDPDAGFDVEYMLDHLVTHRVHVQVMNDIDARYGPRADAAYHVVTRQIFEDLKAAYGL